MSARDLKRMLPVAMESVRREIAGNASGGKYGAGLSSEGYAGGYRDALYAVEAILRGIEPNDNRHYWRPLRDDQP